MRMSRVLGTTTLVALLAGAVASAVSDVASVNASVSVALWISLTVERNADVRVSKITGPETYVASHTTRRRIPSAASWAIADAIL